MQLGAALVLLGISGCQEKRCNAGGGCDGQVGVDVQGFAAVLGARTAVDATYCIFAAHPPPFCMGACCMTAHLQRAGNDWRCDGLPTCELECCVTGGDLVLSQWLPDAGPQVSVQVAFQDSTGTFFTKKGTVNPTETVDDSGCNGPCWSGRGAMTVP